MINKIRYYLMRNSTPDNTSKQIGLQFLTHTLIQQYYNLIQQNVHFEYFQPGFVNIQNKIRETYRKYTYTQHKSLDVIQS